MNWLVPAIPILGAAIVATGLVHRRNLRSAYQRQLDDERLRDKGLQRIIGAADLALLPEPVRRYLQLVGVPGQPLPRAVLVTFDATLTERGAAEGMRGPAWQYDAFDKPKRLFFMETRMKSLPVRVLHDYDGHAASMRVRIASLFDPVALSTSDLARTETVTILNDLCLFAPGWLCDDRMVWTPIDEHSAAVRFTNGPHEVSAILHFNATGELADFVSDDRGALQKDGSLLRLRWSTPVSDYREFGPYRLPGLGKAVYHYANGPFTYGVFAVQGIEWLE